MTQRQGCANMLGGAGLGRFLRRFLEVFIGFAVVNERDDNGVVAAADDGEGMGAADSGAGIAVADGEAVAAGDSQEWLSMGKASRLLQVSEATLRQWGDAGHLQVYRTPGGHRRFRQEDLLALARQGTVVESPTTGDAERSESAALRRIRRRLSQAEVAGYSWYQSIEEGGRGRMRLFGRRLLSLLVRDWPPRKASRQWRETLAEARQLGQEYGSEMAGRGVSLRDTVEAFIFFRSLAMDSMRSRAWTTALELADRALVGVVEGHQEGMGDGK